jgi:predicted O-methyltransferase YrrM
MEMAGRVSALAARFQAFRSTPRPDVVTDTAVMEWIQEVEALGALVSNGSAAKLGPHAASVDNLRLAARTATEKLLQVPWLSAQTKTGLQQYLERNPAHRQVGAYRFSSDWMSKCEAEWREMLSPLAGRPETRALEIGSFEGRSAIWLLENVLTHPTSRMVCVDPFDGPYAPLFDANIAASGAADRVEKLVGFSSTVLRRLPPEPVYDFIYVDGSHQQLDALEDAVLSWRLLKPGGLMTFDDYGMASAQLANFANIDRPDIGIDAFLSAAADKLEIVRKGFQITVRKKAR